MKEDLFKSARCRETVGQTAGDVDRTGMAYVLCEDVLLSLHNLSSGSPCVTGYH